MGSTWREVGVGEGQECHRSRFGQIGSVSLSYLLSKEHPQPSHTVPILTENCRMQCVCVFGGGEGGKLGLRGVNGAY